MRREKDSLGELFVPDDAYYGIQTERAIQNFPISGHPVGDYPRFIWCLAAIKKAAALANRDIGVLDDAVANAICRAADDIMNGKMKDQFPIDVFQGGGGTSTNMNINEVIANRANEILIGHKVYDRVHPNTHVNMCQSTNDVIPSAMKMTCYYHLQELLESIKVLEEVVSDKTTEFKDVVKIARTCLQDAVPITLGQEFSGYLSFLRRQADDIRRIADSCLQLPLGATAVGTELGTFPGYVDLVFQHLNKISGIPVVREQNFFDGLQNGDVYIHISATLKALATGLSKMASDLRLLSSGPRAGLSEIELPAVQPGSSIMPGKVNPVIPEMINQVCYQVCGNDFCITMAVEGGQLDLNVWELVILRCLMESCTLLSNSIPLFARKCVQGIKANLPTCQEYAESSISLSTVISTLFDYETGSKVAKYAWDKSVSVKDAAIEMGLLTPSEAEQLLNPMLLADQKQSAQFMLEAFRGERGNNR